MKNIKSFIVAVVLGSALLVGCDDSENVQNQRYQQTPNQMVDEQYVNQPAPQVVQAAPAQPSTVVVQGGGSGSSGVGDFATGMLLGHMLSGNSGGGGYRDGGGNTTIINNNAAPTTNSKSYTTQKRSFYDKQGNTYTTTKQNTIKQQSVQTYSRPSTTKVNSDYSARKSYSSPISSYSKSSKSYSSSKRSFSSSRRR